MSVILLWGKTGLTCRTLTLYWCRYFWTGARGVRGSPRRIPVGIWLGKRFHTAASIFRMVYTGNRRSAANGSVGKCFLPNRPSQIKPLQGELAPDDKKNKTKTNHWATFQKPHPLVSVLQPSHMQGHNRKSALQGFSGHVMPYRWVFLKCYCFCTMRGGVQAHTTYRKTVSERTR